MANRAANAEPIRIFPAISSTDRTVAFLMLLPSGNNQPILPLMLPLRIGSGRPGAISNWE